MSIADHELLVAAYTFFNERDLDRVLNTMHEDVDWPNGMEGGRVQGHSGVRDYWTRQWSQMDPHVRPVEFEAEDDGRVAVTVHQTVRDLSGRVIADRLVEHVYEIQDGLIRKMDIREIAAD